MVRRTNLFITHKDQECVKHPENSNKPQGRIVLTTHPIYPWGTTNTAIFRTIQDIKISIGSFLIIRDIKKITKGERTISITRSITHNLDMRGGRLISRTIIGTDNNQIRH